MGQRLSPADAVWFRGENPRNPMMVSSILWFDRPLDLDAYRERIVERMLDRHPVFRQRIVASRNPLLMPTWVEDRQFDLDHHIEVLELPAPGDHATLQQWCSAQRSHSLDLRRPPWKVHVFNGYRGDRSAMHVRVHHSVGDGLALMRLLLSMVDEADPDTVALAEDPPPGHLVDGLWHLAEEAVGEFTHLVVHPDAVPTRVRQVWDLTRWSVRLLAPPLPAPSILLGRPSGHKEMAWDPDGLPLDEVKAVGRALGATVNDVLLTALTGALHRYLREHGTQVDQVLVMVPVNLRDPAAPLPRHLGNQIGLLPVLLPTGLATAAERLASIQATIAELRHSPAPVLSRALLAGTSLFTPPGERAIHRLNQLRSTGVVTNVPGPQLPVHLCGARVDGVIGWGGMTGHLNMSVAFISLSGRVFPGVVTDRGVTRDPQRILDHLHEEWAELAADHAPDPTPTPAPMSPGTA